MARKRAKKKTGRDGEEEEEEYEDEKCWHYVGPLILWIGIFIITMVIVQAFNYLAYTRRVLNPQDHVLSDLSFELMPQLNGTYYSTILIYSYVLVFVVLVLVFSPWGVFSIRRMLSVWVPVLLLRSCTVWVTNYPDPSSGCKGLNPLGTGTTLVTNFLLGQSCGDMMFSGHTTAAVLMFLTSIQAFPLTTKVSRARTLLVYILSFLWAVAGIIMVTIERLHYTSDVLVAIIISSCLFGAVNGTLTNKRIQQWGKHCLCRCLPWCERDIDMPVNTCCCGACCYGDVSERLYCFDEHERDTRKEEGESEMMIRQRDG